MKVTIAKAWKTPQGKEIKVGQKMEFPDHTARILINKGYAVVGKEEPKEEAPIEEEPKEPKTKKTK